MCEIKPGKGSVKYNKTISFNSRYKQLLMIDKINIGLATK